MRNIIILAALGMGLPALAQEQVYVRGHVGWAVLGSAGLSATGTPAGSLKSGGDKRGNPIPLGIAVGWDVGDNFRIEGAFDFRSFELDIKNEAAAINGAIADGSALQTTIDDKSDIWSVMLNAVYDMDLDSDQPFYPYFGAGIGWGNATVTAYNTVAADKASNGVDGAARGGFAYNAFVGMAYEFSDAGAFYLEAKFFSMLGGEVDGVGSVKYNTAHSDTSIAAGLMFGF